MKKTKIVCTLGPASQSLSTLSQMLKNGMNVARLNFSHGNYANHDLLIRNLRKAAAREKFPVAIMQDLHGPKIRVATLKQPLNVKIGQRVVIGQDFKLDLDIAAVIRPKQRILIEDGLIELEVEKVAQKKVFCRVLSPGKIQSHKGVNLPRAKIKIAILTPKDIEDLKFGLSRDVDYVALSFVRTGRDVVRLKKLITKLNPKGTVVPKIVAKIEKPEAVKNFEGILKESDAIMIARGDLGVELPESQVPIIQKSFIEKCLALGKPVIVATQMLDSMIRNPKPTRAEVSDVANAVIDQTDCVMLSGETAFGRYPVRAVAEMNRIIEVTEKSVFSEHHKNFLQRAVSKSEAVAEAVFDLVGKTHAKVIVGATDSGFTARAIAHQRPNHTRIVMLTPRPKVLRQLSLIWGVESFLIPKVHTYEELIQKMLQTVRQKQIVKKGDLVVLVTGEPLGQKENLNLVEVKTV